MSITENVNNVHNGDNASFNSMGTSGEETAQFDNVPTNVPTSEVVDSEYVKYGDGNIGNVGTTPYACAAHACAHAQAHTRGPEGSQCSRGSQQVNSHVGNGETFNEEARETFDEVAGRSRDGRLRGAGIPNDTKILIPII